MQVRHSEGVAIHAAPESCAGHCCEAVREALTGARTGLDPLHVRTPLAREPGYLRHRPGRQFQGRIGKAGGRSR